MFTKEIEYELSRAGYSTSNRILTSPEYLDSELALTRRLYTLASSLVYNWTWTYGVSLFNLQ